MLCRNSFLNFYRVAQVLVLSICSIFFIFILYCEPSPVWAIENNSPQDSSTKLFLISAVQQTLSLQPSIKIAEQEVFIKKAYLQEAFGRFDLTINSSLNYKDSSIPLSRTQEMATGESSRDEGVGDLTFSLDQELANGIVLRPSLSLIRTDDQSFGAETQNDASVNFDLIIPLQKGWGKDAVEAGVRAARVSVIGSRFSLQHTTAVSIKEMVAAYWNYVAAEKRVAILRNIENSTRKAVADMETLIKADEKPASDLDPLRASLSDKSFSRVKAEQNLLTARYRLGMAMGLSEVDSASLSHPIDGFPKVSATTGNDKTLRIQSSELISLAKKMRTDLKRLANDEAVLRISQVAADNELKPQLDLVLSAGYNGLAEGDNWKKSINSLSSRVPGLNYGVALNYQFPYQNSSARGRRAQIEANLAQARISTADLERNIVSQVKIEFNNLRRSLEELQLSAESVKIYRQVVANEKEKVRLGMGTVVDLITMADRLENALLAEVSSQQNYAEALLGLRYETGTLINWDGNESSLSLKTLTTIPDPGY